MAKKCSTSCNAKIYEDFEPNFETKEKEGAHILELHLPDFSREQIKVFYVPTTRTIRAEGERRFWKWIRFNRSFHVPQYCNEEKIQGEFRDGILKITIPKKCEKQGITELKTRELGFWVTETADGEKEYVFRGNVKGKDEIGLLEGAAAAMKTVMEEKEERSLIFTTGVAAVVIAAVGAYAMFKIRYLAQNKG